MKLNKWEACGQKILEDFPNPVGPQSEPYTSRNFNGPDWMIDTLLFKKHLTFFDTKAAVFLSGTFSASLLERMVSDSSIFFIFLRKYPEKTDLKWNRDGTRRVNSSQRTSKEKLFTFASRKIWFCLTLSLHIFPFFAHYLLPISLYRFLSLSSPASARLQVKCYSLSLLL